jgi:hypothetical protein
MFTRTVQVWRQVCTLWNGEYILPYDKSLCAQCCCCLFLITKHGVLFKTSIQNTSTQNFYKTVKIFLTQAQNRAFGCKLPPICLLQKIQILVHCEVWRFPWANASSHTKVNFFKLTYKRTSRLVFVLEAALESEWQPYWKSPHRHFGPSALCYRKCSPYRPGGASSYRASGIPSRTPGKRVKKAV